MKTEPMKTEPIKNHLHQKIITNQTWENEYGVCNKTCPFRETYKTIQDFKVEYKAIDNITYFKIIPLWFKSPYTYMYWKTNYDGYIENDQIYWQQP